MLSIVGYTIEEEIIVTISSIQIASLKRLLEDKMDCEEDITLHLIENEVSLESFKASVSDSINNFQKLLDDPTDLRVLPEEDASMFRHTLANLEHEYKPDFNKDVSSLWQRLFLLEKVKAQDIYPPNLN